jgi:hypothetical protein
VNNKLLKKIDAMLAEAVTSQKYNPEAKAPEYDYRRK